MKCIQCNSEFPTCIVVNGIKRNLKNRTKCVSCLPFKSEESKSRKNSRIKSTVKVIRCCKRCNKSYNSGKGSYVDYCISCRVTIQRKELKQKAVDYLGSVCSVCGYNKSLRALQFHHVDASDKDFNISSKGVIKWESIKAELDKCILLCSNCHAELHEKENPY